MYTRIVPKDMGIYILGGGGVQGQVKGQRLMSNIVVNDYQSCHTSPNFRKKAAFGLFCQIGAENKFFIANQ